MDRQATLVEVKASFYDDEMIQLIEGMSAKLSDDEFRECLRPILSARCGDTSDIGTMIEGALENAETDMFYDYYDPDDSPRDDLDESQIGGIKDCFGFLKLMALTGMDDDVKAYSRKVSEALRELSSLQKYKSYSILASLADEIDGCIEKGDCAGWLYY
jgi:hypothetical protein